MDSRYAVIADTSVIDLVMWDGESEWEPVEGVAVGPLPDDSPVSIGYTYDGKTFTAPAVQTPPTRSAQELADEIDNTFASVYSNWSRFQQEYLLREQAAQAFKDAGYAGDPGVWVSAFSTSAGLTGQQAADLILAQAATLNGALATLGALRMRKYEVLDATNAITYPTIYADIVAKINAVAAAIQ